MKLNWRDNRVLYRWSMTPAAWWQFWMPQSGLPGGAIGAALIILAAMWLLSAAP